MSLARFNLVLRLSSNFRQILTVTIRKIAFTILTFHGDAFPGIPSALYLKTLERTGFFDSYNLSLAKPNSSWERAYQYSNEGNFTKALELRKKVLVELYERNGISAAEYFPHYISEEYLNAIGHQALLGVHVAAQEFGIIPRGLRSANLSPSNQRKPLLGVFANKINFVPYAVESAWTELPINWHVAERLQLIRGFDEFIDMYELIERVYSHRTISSDSPLFRISDEYEERSRFALGKLGLPSNAWFVGLHIRDDGLRNSRRNQEIGTYIDSMNEITKRGGWVIRIGDETMTKLPIMPKVLDLTSTSNASRELHLYVMSKAKFFIGTTSGSASIPPLFGVPNLITNTTSIGRNVWTSSQHSIYIPKILSRINGRRLSFKEVLQSPDAFSELDLSQLETKGLRLQPNTSEDILSGVREMFNRIDNHVPNAATELNAVVNRVRSQFPWTSKGFFSSNFLERNFDWFLK